MKIKNSIPSFVSLSRIPLGYCVYHFSVVENWRTAFLCLALAAATDAADGYLAIKLKAKSVLGGWIDALCDLCMTSGAYFGIWCQNIFPKWFMLLVFFVALFLWSFTYLGKQGSKVQSFFDGILPFYYLTGLFTFLSVYLIQVNDLKFQIIMFAIFAPFSFSLVIIKKARIQGWLEQIRYSFRKAAV